MGSIRDRWLPVKSRTERFLRPRQDTPSQSFAARLSFFTSRDVIHTSRNWAYIISHRWLWPPLLLAGAVLSSILHNVLSGIFKIDEPVFLL